MGSVCMFNRVYSALYDQVGEGIRWKATSMLILIMRIAAALSGDKTHFTYV